MLNENCNKNKNEVHEEVDKRERDHKHGARWRLKRRFQRCDP